MIDVVRIFDTKYTQLSNFLILYFAYDLKLLIFDMKVWKDFTINN